MRYLLPVWYLAQGEPNTLFRIGWMDLLVWGAVLLIMSALMAWLYWHVQSWFGTWMYARRRNATVVYLAQVVLGLVIAALIDRIGFRELLSGALNDLDRILMPAFTFLLPPFAALSVLIPVCTANEIDRAHRLERLLQQYGRVYRYISGIRDDVVRLADCVSGARAERTQRLAQIAALPTPPNCLTIAHALDSAIHTERLLQAIHHVFELRGQSAPGATSSDAETPEDGVAEPGDAEPGAAALAAARAGDTVSWRVCLLEEQDGVLGRSQIWNGHSSACCFTPEGDWRALFSTVRRQAGTFAVNCYSSEYPIIIDDAAKAHDEPTSGFKYFARSPDQRRRILSIAGFSIQTEPKRVLVLDSDRKGFFSERADKALLRQLQRIVQGEFEFEAALMAVVDTSRGGCPSRSAGGPAPGVVGLPTSG